MSTDAKPEDIEQALRALSLNKSDTDAVTLLANASREDERVRHRLADPQSLRTLVETIECSLTESLSTLDLALRCVGNACADNNDARDTISSLGFRWALQCLASDDDEVKVLTTKVLYNICSDHEPSQQQCYRDQLHYELFNFLDTEYALDSSDNTFAIDLLFWISGQKAAIEPTLPGPISEEFLTQLLELPQAYAELVDLENFSSFVEAALAFLRDATVQEQVVRQREITTLWGILEIAEEKGTELNPDVESEAEDLKVLTPLCTSLIWCLSDIAARPDFATAYADELRGNATSIMTPSSQKEDAKAASIVGTLVSYIKSNAEGRSSWDTTRGTDGALFTAACQVLGNLLWGSEPASYAHLVEREQLHISLFRRIVHTGRGPSAAMILHSACGLLIHLCRPSPNVRNSIGCASDAMPAMEILGRHEMTQIKQDSIKLLKALGTDCPPNQERFTELAKEVLEAVRQNSDTNMAGAGPS